MPEKIVIAELDIDMDKAIADTIKLRQEEERLKALQAEAKKSQGALSAEYIQYSAQLKATQTELRSQEGLLIKVTQANNAQSGSQDQLKARLSVVTKQWSQLSKDERDNTEIGKKLSKQKLDLTNALKKEEIATGDARRNVGNYGDQIGKATGVISKMVPGLGAATDAAEHFGTALKFALGPIGLIIAAIAALVSYFKRSEEGQNALTKVVAVFNVVLQNILDIIGDVGKALFEAVTKPKEAWQKFKDFIGGVGQFFKDTFGNVIGGSIDVFTGFLQKAFAQVNVAWQKLKNVFKDNTDGINKAQAKVDEYNQKIADGQARVALGAENLKEGIVNAYNSAKNAVSDFIKENEREIAIAKRLADQQANLNKLIRDDTIKTGQETLRINNLKNQIDDKTNRTAQERLKLLAEENAILDVQEKRQLSIAQQKYDLKKAQDALSSSTKEDLDEEAKLLADVYNVQARIEAQRKEGVAKRVEIENQIRQEALLTAQSAVDNFQYELEAYRLANKDKLGITEETNKRQIEIWQQGLQVKINEIDAKDNESESAKNAEKLKLQNDFNLQVQQLNSDFEESERQRKIDVAQTDYDNQLELLNDNILGQLELERQGNELKRQEEIRAAEKTGADVNLINKKYAKANEALAKAERDAKLTLLGDFANNVATIAGQNTKVGKAAAAAATTVATYQGATSAFASLAPIPIVGPILGAVAAAAAIVSGIQNVRKIYAVQPGATPSGDSNSASPSTPTATLTSSLQSVNTDIGQGIVSRATDTLNGTQQKQENVLVVDKVTDAQRKEDSKIQTATI